MKKLTLDQWEKKYIIGPIERFDSKNQMFSRPTWDPDIKSRLEDWSFRGEIKQKPGYTLQDHALQRASRTGTMLARLKARRNPNLVPGVPVGDMATLNPGRVATEVASSRGPATATADPVMPRTYQPSEEAKIDVSDPQALTRDIKKAAHYFGASLVGTCKLDRRWVYLNEEIPEEFQYVVVMAFEEEYDLIKYCQTQIAGVATTMGYSRMAITNAYLSAFIENLGFKAMDCQNDTALSVPMALQAGLGEQGRLGFLVTPEFGPRVRLSKVITDLPLVADSPIDFGVTEFCTACKKCAQQCPSQSIPHGDRTTEPHNISNNSGGELKWQVDAETCRMYWSRVKRGCTTCQACCPYNKANTWPHRTARWFTDHIRWADPLYIKMDDFFGYGKPRKADNFWEEWQSNQC